MQSTTTTNNADNFSSTKQVDKEEKWQEDSKNHPHNMEGEEKSTMDKVKETVAAGVESVKEKVSEMAAKIQNMTSGPGTEEEKTDKPMPKSEFHEIPFHHNKMDETAKDNVHLPGSNLKDKDENNFPYQEREDLSKWDNNKYDMNSGFQVDNREKTDSGLLHKDENNMPYQEKTDLSQWSSEFKEKPDFPMDNNEEKKCEQSEYWDEYNQMDKSQKEWKGEELKQPRADAIKPPVNSNESKEKPDFPMDNKESAFPKEEKKCEQSEYWDEYNQPQKGEELTQPSADAIKPPVNSNESKEKPDFPMDNKEEKKCEQSEYWDEYNQMDKPQKEGKGEEWKQPSADAIMPPVNSKDNRISASEAMKPEIHSGMDKKHV